MVILYILIGLCVGGCGIYLLLRPKIKITAQKNIAIEMANQQLEIENNNLLQINQYRQELLEKTTQEYYEMGAKRTEIKQALEDLKETQQKAADDLYSQALNIAENSYQQEIDRISNDLFQQREEAKKLYLETTEEAVGDYLKAINEKQKEFSYWTDQMNALQENVQVALEAAKRK